MEAASTTSSAGSSADGPSVGGGSDGGYLNLGMFSASGGNTQQQQQQSGELLVGGAGGGFSLANGFGNATDSNGAPASGTSFDLSDFPSLGGGNTGAGSGAPGSGSGLAAAIRQQQQLLAHQQMLQNSNNNNSNSNNNNSGNNNNNGSKGAGGSNLYRMAMTGSNGNFNMASEDFPALSVGPSQAGGSGVSNNTGLNATSLLGGNNSGAMQRTNGDGLYGGLENANSQLDGGAGLLAGAGLSGLGGLRGLQQSGGNPNPSISKTPTGSGSAGAIGSSVPSGSGTGSTAGTALSGDYGLLGLLGVIRMTDADRNALALGSDLTLLGLNLASTEQIYSTFSSPWSDNVAAKEPHYQLPMCYYMQPPALKTGHLSKFQLETLFYIFYALPKDVLQAYAAQELYTREWRYHGDLKLWFKRAGPSDGIAASSGGMPQYLYFDINTWERRLFNGSMNQNITNGFLPEDEVRVKFSSS